MTEQELYDMELHKTVKVNQLLHVTRVPGGLIYKSYTSVGAVNCNISTCFVPLSNPVLKKS